MDKCGISYWSTQQFEKTHSGGKELFLVVARVRSGSKCTYQCELTTRCGLSGMFCHGCSAMYALIESPQHGCLHCSVWICCYKMCTITAAGA